MVLGLLVIAGIPTTIGVSEALSAQKKQNAAQKEKARFHMTAELSLDGRPPVECWVVLADGRLYIDHPQAPAPGHKFSGYYFTYPSDAGLLGLVSTIADDPPMLNWIFVDKDTGLVRHGGRKDTLEHLIGPWGWSEDEKWLALEGNDLGFVAVEDPENKKWSVCLDRDLASSTSIIGHPVDGGEEDDDAAVGCPRWAVVKLRRKLELGMDSRWVRDSERDGKGGGAGGAAAAAGGGGGR